MQCENKRAEKIVRGLTCHYENYFNTLMNYIVIVRAVLWQLPFRYVFGGFYNFLLFMSALVLISAQKSAKIPLHGNFHNAAPTMDTYPIKVAYER